MKITILSHFVVSVHFSPTVFRYYDHYHASSSSPAQHPATASNNSANLNLSYKLALDSSVSLLSVSSVQPNTTVSRHMSVHVCLIILATTSLTKDLTTKRMSSIFALCCIFASCASPTFAQYGYGPTSASGKGGYGGTSSSGAGVGAFGGHGPISAAIRTSHHVDFIDVPKSEDNYKSATIEVGASPLPLNIVFRSASSTLNLLHQHDPAMGDVQESSSEDEPHRLYHTVKKPIIQEVYEIIAPYRKITQKIEPVQEEIQTIITRQNGEQRVLEKAPKYVDDLTTLKTSQIISSPPPVPVSPSVALRTDSGSLIKILKQASFGGEAKPTQQLTDDMYRSGSTPTFMFKESSATRVEQPKSIFTMMPDFSQESLPLLPPPSDFFHQHSSRGRMMRKNRRMPPSMLDPNLPSYNSYEALIDQYSNDGHGRTQSNEISQSRRNEIKIHKPNKSIPKFAHPWTFISNPAVQLYESFDDVYRSAKMNRYEPVTQTHQPQQQQQEDDLFNLVRFEDVNAGDRSKSNNKRTHNRQPTKSAGDSNKRLLSSYYSAISDDNQASAGKSFEGDESQHIDDNEVQSGEQAAQQQQLDEVARKALVQSDGDASVDVRDGNEQQVRGNATDRAQLVPPPPLPTVATVAPVDDKRDQQQHVDTRKAKAEVFGSSKQASTGAEHSWSGHNLTTSKSVPTAVNANSTASPASDQKRK